MTKKPKQGIIEITDFHDGEYLTVYNIRPGSSTLVDVTFDKTGLVEIEADLADHIPTVSIYLPVEVIEKIAITARQWMAKEQGK